MTSTLVSARHLPSRSRLLVTLLSVIGALALVVLPVDAANAQTPVPVQYEVVIEGTASNNPFQRTGVLTVLPTLDGVASSNGVNPFEVCLESGAPISRPEPGAIRYGTNSGCFRNNGPLLDLAHVATDGVTYQTQPDAELQATLINLWNATGSITSPVYSPYAGETTYVFASDGTVTGTIELYGHGGFDGHSTYLATFVGRRVA